MGEKYYKPKLKPGEQLLRSKDNPDTFRGLSRDSNNKNPGIPEWEEVEIPTRNNSLSERVGDYVLDQAGNALGYLISTAIITGTDFVMKKYAVPWAEEKAIPTIKEYGSAIFHALKGDAELKAKTIVEDKQVSTDIIVCNGNKVDFDKVDAQVDNVFQQQYFDMDEAELNQHLLNIVQHMLGIANEIRIVSNSCIRKENENDEQYEIAKKMAEDYLVQKVSDHLDDMLSKRPLHLDDKMSRQMTSLLGGGIFNQEEYVPVEPLKVKEAMMLQDKNED